MKRPATTLALLAFILTASGMAASEAASPSRIAVLGLHFENTSPEPTRPDEVQRLAMVNQQLLRGIEDSPRFEVVPIPSPMVAKIDGGPQVGACGGCEIDYGKALGVNEIAWGNVQKVSNLILNINVYIDNVDTGRRTFVHSVDIRGNDDRSWSKGLAFLLNNHLLKDDAR